MKGKRSQAAPKQRVNYWGEAERPLRAITTPQNPTEPRLSWQELAVKVGLKVENGKVW